MATLERHVEGGLEVVTLSQGTVDKHYITAHPEAGGGTFGLFDAVGRFLKRHNAVIVAQDVFGPCKMYAQGVDALRHIAPEQNWPITWLEGDRQETEKLTGAQLYAVTDPHGHVRPIEINGRVVGIVHETDEMTMCLLGDLRTEDTQAPRGEQCRQTWALMEEALAKAGLNFSDVTRTWLYVDKILEWYGELNQVRDTFFRQRNVFDGLVPASTGVGVANPSGSALVADVLAIRPKHPGVRIFAVPSPLQCSALDYRSSFSRAVEVVTPDLRRLYVSGTASIEPGGKTAFVDDVRKQIELSMDVLHAILTSRGMDWGDVSRAIAYFRNMSSAAEFTAYCRDHNIPQFPCAVSHADICRDDLLFEIEADAMTTRPL